MAALTFISAVLVIGLAFYLVFAMFRAEDL
ncbi:MAG: K(+)-transporting ATPase subunit F [Spirochaetales bacterium]|nr:K(+)-transporting ATPase subunit F [Spirochaetales bacterium]